MVRVGTPRNTLLMGCRSGDGEAENWSKRAVRKKYDTIGHVTPHMSQVHGERCW